MYRTAIIAAGALALASTFPTAPAQALSDRTFVSGHGSDSNPCSLAAPCRTFAQAITQTNAGGEVAVLDTAGYGSFTISKSISIINQDGVEAGITAPMGQAITIAAASSDAI